ncbi:glycosyltransferase family 2 protein [Fervidibacillus halotolerans]|uniref:Glycosyltransferase n=1 Tax=Fervidibacillus halotolerans TaxID=2980027 RepID=A0A9E8M1A9_9BACI|nr:glycosyltransferase [Fervidibacillus halotolerans]WAA13132.1 glycosyltransferase [Fervidibacillus halotolerans]
MNQKQKRGLVSIIIPVKNEGIHIQNTIQSLFESKTRYPFEVIVVDDHSTDGCCDFLRKNKDERIHVLFTDNVGVAMARNIGAERAKGKFVIFCDAHLFFEPYWIDRLLYPIEKKLADATNPGIANAKNPQAIGYGYTWNENLEVKWNGPKRKMFESPLLAAGCLAMKKSTFDDIGGFDRGFRVWGRNDDEISLKLWLFGYRCAVIPHVKIQHVFRKGSEVPFHFTWDDVYYNFMRMAYSHFNEKRIEKCKKQIKHSNPDQIIRELLKSDVLEQRKRYFEKRTYDDDWFMNKFGIPF